MVALAQKKRDWTLASQIAAEVYNNQAQLTNQEILLRFKQMRDAIKFSLYDMIPTNVPAQVDPALLINTFALGRLLEVSSSKCTQVHHRILRGNVHRSNYLDLARISRLFFRSDNVLRLIDSFADAQSRICRGSLIYDMRETWSRIEKLHKQYAQRFKRKLLALIPPKNSVDQLSSREKIDAITNFLGQFYKVNLDEKSIVATYNRSFRQACNILLLDPFWTPMMTYESVNRQRVKMDRYLDLIWLYDLCKHLPDEIESIESIGRGQNRAQVTLEPAAPGFRPSLGV